MFQIARPDGNVFERWKWRHRYFIWTWSLSGVAVLATREALTHVDAPLVSWFTLSSYLLAIPVAIGLGALYCAGLALAYRSFPPQAVDPARRFLAKLPTRVLFGFVWALAISALGIILLCTLYVFTYGAVAGLAWTAVIVSLFVLVHRARRRA